MERIAEFYINGRINRAITHHSEAVAQQAEESGIKIAERTKMAAAGGFPEFTASLLNRDTTSPLAKKAETLAQAYQRRGEQDAALTYIPNEAGYYEYKQREARRARRIAGGLREAVKRLGNS